MNTRKKHHFAPWSYDRSGLQGLAQVTILQGEPHSHCTACGIKVKSAAVGGTKFWVGGRWVSKAPCTGTKPV